MKKDSIYLLVICLLAFFFVRQCNSDKGQEGPGKDQNTDTLSHTSDTFFMPGRVDTFFLPGEIEYRDKPAELIDVEIDTVTNDSTFIFKTMFSDSMLDATITSKLKGLELTTDFKYSPKFPKYIRSTDTLRITNSTVVQKNKLAFYLGGSTGGSLTSFSLQPSFLIKTKKHNLYGYGYDLILKTHNVKGYILIKNPFAK